VVLGDDRSRHLCCALCATRWHLPRIRCAACQATDAISYLSVEGAPPGVRAETCDRCHSYLKLLDLQDLPEAEPLADDAATIVLDLLMGERGYRRAGLNLLAPAAAPA
jgi:FdhE protein